MVQIEKKFPSKYVGKEWLGTKKKAENNKLCNRKLKTNKCKYFSNQFIF